MDASLAYGKARRFSARIIRLCRYLSENGAPPVLTEQLLRAVFGIGAAISETRCAASRIECFARLRHAKTHCAETAWYLDLIRDANLLTDTEFRSIHTDFVGLVKAIEAALTPEPSVKQS